MLRVGMVAALLLLLPALGSETQDPLLPQQWGLQAIHAPEAWSLLPASHPHALIAILDTGVDWKHPDLASVVVNIHPTDLDPYAQLSGVRGIDLTTYGTAAYCLTTVLQSPPCPYSQIPPDELLNAMDFDGHGTHIAGICCAAVNDVGIRGVSDAYVLPVKVLVSGHGPFNAPGVLAAGIEAVLPLHPQVIEMSLGTYQDDPVLRQAVQDAIGSDALVIAAAGNDGTDRPMYPASYPGVVSVAAVGPDLQAAPWSNYGPNITLAAPGVGILSDGSRWYSDFGLHYRDPTYVNMSGTSMAVPFVGGAAALMWERHPIIPMPAILRGLEYTASNNGTWNNHTGYGVINVGLAMQDEP